MKFLNYSNNSVLHSLYTGLRIFFLEIIPRENKKCTINVVNLGHQTV